MTNIPKSFLKSLDEIALANFYEAKQRYILHLGESLIMHLSSFVLAEYRESGLTFLKVEKDIVNMKKSLSLGIYVGWIRDTAQFLAKNNKPSLLNDILTTSIPNEEVSLFILSYENFKKALESGETENLFDHSQKLMKGSSLSKVSLNDFLNTFVQLRNKIAHPIYEIKNKPGKMVSWPFNDDYYRFMLPPLERAVKQVMEDLRNVWEYNQWIVTEKDKNNVLLSDESGEFSTTIASPRDMQEELKVLLNKENHLLINDWSELLKPKEEAIAAIHEEQEQLKKINSIVELKNNIVHCLDDGQISVEEFKFLESITKAKLNMSSDELRLLIIQTAQEQGIDDPFPEVDTRFVEAIDKAIKSKTFNGLVLKLMGEQYGVTAEDFEKLVDARAYALGIPSEEARKSNFHQFDAQGLKLYQSLAMSRMWLMGIAKLNVGTNFKIDGDSNDSKTKEYWHKFAFNSLQKYIEHKLKSLQQEGGLQWTTKQNQWQIGNMTSYAWCSIFPLNAPTKAALALHVSAYSDGSIATGFLPDWKDQKDMEHFGLLQFHTRKNLRRFFQKYLNEFYKYPDLVLWDRISEKSYAPITEVLEKYPWYFETDYTFEQIQFCQTMNKTIENPGIVSESFDIIFNLFNALIPEITQDYLLHLPEIIDPLEKQLDDAKAVLNAIQSNISNHLTDPSIIEKQEDHKRGTMGITLEEKKNGCPTYLQFRMNADYSNEQIHYDIKIRCGQNISDYHQHLDELLEQLDFSYPEVQRLYRKSCLILRYSFLNIKEAESRLLEITAQFIQQFTLELSRKNIALLGLKPVLMKSETYIPMADLILDGLLETQKEYFSNAIKKERNITKELRYLDYNDSNKKHGQHWLGYGITWQDEQNPKWCVVLHLQNTLTGSQLLTKMETFASQNGFDAKFTGAALDASLARWRIDEAKDDQITASSEYNRNHSARLSKLNSEHKYANWSAKKCDDSQWIQLDLLQKSMIFEVALQGRFNREQWITRYDLLVSDNGKDWTLIAANHPGVDSCEEVQVLVLTKPVIARYVRIQPKEWHGWISLRFDVKACDVLPNQFTIEKTWDMDALQPDQLMTETAQTLQKVYDAFKGEFGIR